MSKGFEGYIGILPETEGWGSSTNGEGFFLYADSESLSVGQEFIDRPDKLVQGRSEKPGSRTKGPQKPNGDLEFQFRTNDCLPVLMAHFQKYIGSSIGGTASGTANYTFVPENSQPDWVGSSFGTGLYHQDPGDVFTFGLIKKIRDRTGEDNSMWFQNCIVDKLSFTLAAGEDAKMSASIKSRTVDAGTFFAAALNPPSSFGSYSSLPALQWYAGTFSIGGRTDLDVTSITFTSENGIEDKLTIGNINPSKFDLGRSMVSGVIEMDAPKEVLRHIGSMVNDLDLSIYGTLYNSANDYMIIEMKNCKYEPFDINLSGANSTTSYGLAFKAFESDDGGTAPIKITVRTTGVGSSFNVV